MDKAAMLEKAHDMTMYTTSATALAVMVAVCAAIFLLGKFTRRGIPLAVNILVSAFAGAGAAGFGFPLPHLFEGMEGFIYINLSIMGCMIFLTCLRYSGQLDAIAADIRARFGHSKMLLLGAITLLLFLPGLVTGVGFTALFGLGPLAAGILRTGGLSDTRIAAFLAVITALSAAAPPVNLPVMLMTYWLDMSNRGFCPLLLALVAALTAISMLCLGRGFTANAQTGSGVRSPGAYLPILAVFALFILNWSLPGSPAALGIPLIFILGSLVCLVTGDKFNYIAAGQEALRGPLLRLIALIFTLGGLIQILALTGAQGLLAMAALELAHNAPWLVYVLAAVAIPVLGGVLTHIGLPMIIGLPFCLALVSDNPVAVVSGLSLLCVMGQFFPASALSLGPACAVSNAAPWPVFKLCLAPMLLIAGTAVLVLVFPDQFAAWFT